MSAILNNIYMMFMYLFGGTHTFAAGDLGTGSASVTIDISWADSMLGGIVTTVTNNPILLIFVIFGLSFAAVGLFKRLTR